VSKYPSDYTALRTSQDTLFFTVTSVTTSISPFQCYVKVYGESEGITPRILNLSIRKAMVSFMSQLSHLRGENARYTTSNGTGQAPGTVQPLFTLEQVMTEHRWARGIALLFL
jgi:hypothetical protein